VATEDDPRYQRWRAQHPRATTFRPHRQPLDETYPMDLFDDDRDRWGSAEQMVGFHLWGLCPSCGDATRSLCATQYLTQSGEPPTTTQPDARIRQVLPPALDHVPEPAQNRALTCNQVTVMKCGCIEDHDGAAGGFGCGAEWLLRVFYAPGTGSPVLKVAVPPDEAARVWAVVDANGAAIPPSSPPSRPRPGSGRPA
jgi:hypothetical protein